MKNFALSLALAAAALGFLSAAHAGIKEGTGDASLVFKCKSLPNADSDIRVYGTISDNGRGIALELMVGDQKAGIDKGHLSADGKLFQGQVFDIQFGTPSKITAKAPTRYMNPGDTESLNCEFSDKK